MAQQPLGALFEPLKSKGKPQENAQRDGPARPKIFAGVAQFTPLKTNGAGCHYLLAGFAFVMGDLGPGYIVNFPAGIGAAATPVGFFKVHKKCFVNGTHLLPGFPPDEQGCTHGPIHLLCLVGGLVGKMVIFAVSIIGEPLIK